MAAPRTWSFTVAQPDPAPGVCPCGLWTDATQPTSMTDPDTVAVELGTAFSADTDGSVTGVRFYKGPENTGTHTGLPVVDATAPASRRPRPPASRAPGGRRPPSRLRSAITAGTTYVASYLAPNGKYSATPGAGSPRRSTSPPLHTSAAPVGTSTARGYPGERVERELPGRPRLRRAAHAAGRHDATGRSPGSHVATAGSTATVTWTTDESATSVVLVGHDREPRLDGDRRRAAPATR